MAAKSTAIFGIYKSSKSSHLAQDAVDQIAAAGF